MVYDAVKLQYRQSNLPLTDTLTLALLTSMEDLVPSHIDSRVTLSQTRKGDSVGYSTSIHAVVT